MKRTIIAAALIAGVMSAHAAFVSSDNIYGIINIPIVEGYNAIGVNLLPMPGDANQVENIVLTNGLVAGADLSTGDNLSVWNGSGYTDYWYAGNGVWAKSGENPATIPANLGSAAWIKRKDGAGSTTIYQVGMVSPDASTNIAANAGNTFIANPFPVATELNGGNLLWNGTTVATGKTKQSQADLIRVWNGTGYTTFWYCTHPTDPQLSGWKYGNQSVNVTIQPGEGFWLFRREGSVGSTPIPADSPFQP